jgi:gluconate 2-dehydrogenase
MLSPRWETRDPADPIIAQTLVRELGISTLLASLLTSRDITDPGEADHFLHPRLASLPDPLATPGLEAAARRIAESEHYLRRGEWTKWSYDMFTGPDVHGATLGILGMGRIGQGIARRGALGFGMKVIYHNRSRLPPAAEAPIGARWVDKPTLLREADHLVLVLPYSPASHHVMGAEDFRQMKPGATLTNIARGGIVDDAALAEALRGRRIAAAGLDVFEGEPSVHPGLLAVPNVVLTPHIASASVATRRAMARLAADNLIAALTGGTPPTPINPEVLGR